MQHEQYIIQSDAQKTFDTIIKGKRIFENQNKTDCFVDWIDRNGGESRTFEQLNSLFLEMRQSSVYSFKRLSMKMQYEILRLGLEASMLALAN